MTEQRTDDWFAQRLGKVTASRVSDVIAKTKSGYSASRDNYMADLIVERLTGQKASSFSNAAMEWGTATEPAARAAKVCREFCCPGSSTEPRSVVRHDSNVKIAHGRSDVPLANNASMLVGNLPHLLVRRRERKMQRFKS